MAVAALAAAPLAEPAFRAGSELARSVTAQIAAALGTPLLSTEAVIVRQTKKGVRTLTSRASVPAWLVVGGAFAFWMLGIGLGVVDDKIKVTNRPRVNPDFKLF